MSRININNIENVEGKYHLMFYEGREMMKNAKTEKRYALTVLLFFTFLVVLFIYFSNFNLFYVGFVGVFLVIFAITMILLNHQKNVGKKQCIYAVQNSKASEIVNKQVDARRAGKIVAKSFYSTFDNPEMSRKEGRKKQRALSHKITDFKDHSK